MYDFNNTYTEMQILRLEVEDMEDIFLVEEIQGLWYNDLVEATLDDYWSNGCELTEDMREILIDFYVLTYCEDCLYVMENGDF